MSEIGPFEGNLLKLTTGALAIVALAGCGAQNGGTHAETGTSQAPTAAATTHAPANTGGGGETHLDCKVVLTGNSQTGYNAHVEKTGGSIPGGSESLVWFTYGGLHPKSTDPQKVAIGTDAHAEPQLNGQNFFSASGKLIDKKGRGLIICRDATINNK